MRKLLRKIEAALVAAAFAEEGEAETARQIMADAAADAAPVRNERDPLLARARDAAPLAKRPGAYVAR